MIGTLWQREGLREGVPGADGQRAAGRDNDDDGMWLRVSGGWIDGGAVIGAGAYTEDAS